MNRRTSFLTLLVLLASSAALRVDAACKDVYTVQSGDALSVIAEKNGVTQDDLLDANPDITNPDSISVGQKINIPPCDGGGSGDCGTYTVKAGDTLSQIAADQGTTTDALLAANPDITDPDAISVGQVIKLPCGSGEPAPVPTPEPDTSAPNPTGVSVSAAEFAAAVSANNYEAVPDAKRVAWLASIDRLGGGTVVGDKRELAMYLAQIFHESIGLSTTKEIGGESASYAPYYGRGYIQLTNEDNYAKASQAIFGDDRLVQNPDQILEDDNLAWDVTAFYWKTRVHGLVVDSPGQFGVTTVGINGGECGTSKAQIRCDIYAKVLTEFNIDEEADCSGCT